jgi:hypothetical protein
MVIPYKNISVWWQKLPQKLIKEGGFRKSFLLLCFEMGKSHRKPSQQEGDIVIATPKSWQKIVIKPFFGSGFDLTKNAIDKYAPFYME